MTKRQLKHKLKPGVLILISGFAGTYRIDRSIRDWGDYSRKKFLYMVVSKVSVSSDDYIVMSDEGRLVRIRDLVYVETIELLT